MNKIQDSNEMKQALNILGLNQLPSKDELRHIRDRKLRELSKNELAAKSNLKPQLFFSKVNETTASVETVQKAYHLLQKQYQTETPKNLSKTQDKEKTPFRLGR